MEVTVRELKAQLSAVIRRVRAGETATVTLHRRPVVRLVPAEPGDDSIDGKLIRAGLMLAPPQPLEPWTPPPRVPPPRIPSLADAVLEDRG